MLLSLLIIPLVAAALVPLVSKKQVPWVALLGTLVPLVPVGMLLASHDWFASAPASGAAPAMIRITESYGSWFADLGIAFNFRIDGLSMSLVALTALLGPLCVLGSWTAINQHVRTFYGWLLVLQSAMYGVFCAQDLIIFYICFEFTLVPMFVLISLFGSSNRKAAAVKFFLYTFTGSVIALAGLVYVAWFHATQVAPAIAGGLTQWTFDIPTLMASAQRMPPQAQAWVFAAMMLGFAVKVPLFPLHTWLPLAHTEAPTAGSVVLAGVLLKLGTYAIFTFAIPFTPQAAIMHAPIIATLAVLGILVGGLICWVQTDVKKLVAYSSVAHLGFCMLGMFALNTAGLQGAVLYMINHGLSTGALFLCIGFMYERYHTRSMHEIGGLAARMPIWATFMVFFSMASVGLPGLNGFVSEFLCVMGAYQANDVLRLGAGMQGAGLGPWYAFLAGIGMIIGAIYILYMVGKVVFGPLKEPAGHADHHGHGNHADHAAGAHATHAVADAEHGLPADLTRREILALAPLAILCLVLGVFPRPLMNMVMPNVQQHVSLIEQTRRAVGEDAQRARDARDAAMFENPGSTAAPESSTSTPSAPSAPTPSGNQPSSEIRP
jgi:NADH-quinone oxidoreductase subunit M